MEAMLGRLEACGLEVRRSRREIEVTNPRDLEMGVVSVDLTDGYVSWERVQWTHWGPYRDLGGDAEAAMVAERIITALTGDARPAMLVPG
jgi:hypothetical protein